MSLETPLILLSGMGADDSVFAPQIAEFSKLTVPKWIPPQGNESLASYAERFAHQIDPGSECFIGGASFGGFIAIEMARHLNAKGCFLIGSVRSPKELPMRIKMLRRAAPARKVIPFGWFCRLAGISAATCGDWSAPTTKTLLQQFSNSDAEFLRWATYAVLTWESSDLTCNVPIFQIHGDCDHVLPIGRTLPDRIINGAGHVLSLTHPREVNDFLRESMSAQRIS